MNQLYQRNPAAETAPLGKGLMVLEPAARKFCALNYTSLLIWKRLEEPASVEQLVRHIIENFQGVSEEEASRDVAAILREMTTLGIVSAVR